MCSDAHSLSVHFRDFFALVAANTKTLFPVIASSSLTLRPLHYVYFLYLHGKMAVDFKKIIACNLIAKFKTVVKTIILYLKYLHLACK